MPDLYDDEEFAYMHQPHQIHMERSDSAYDSEVRDMLVFTHLLLRQAVALVGVRLCARATHRDP